MTGGTSNHISGGVFFGFVVQGQYVSLTLPDRPDPTLAGLPRQSATFAGRRTELEQVLSALAPTAPTAPDETSGQGKPGSTVVVSGLAGMGKTELALQAAHRALREEGWFPGGVLFADLHGYDEEHKVSPKRALGTLLRALGVPRSTFPPGSRNVRSSTAPPSALSPLPGGGSWSSWTTYRPPPRSATSCRVTGARPRSCPHGTLSRSSTPWQ